MSKAPRSLEPHIVAPYVDFEFYWEDKCRDRFKNVRPEEHGNSYKQAFIELNLQEQLEKYRADGNLEGLRMELIAGRISALHECFY